LLPPELIDRESLDKSDPAQSELYRFSCWIKGGDQCLSDANLRSMRVFLELIGQDAVEDAMAAAADRLFDYPDDAWRYMCGILWNWIRTGSTS